MEPVKETEATNLPLVEEAGAPPEVATVYARYRESFGRAQVPGILKCFATHPPLLEHMLGIAQSVVFSEGALGRRNKELIATFVSAHNRCDYCADSHGSSLRGQGGSDELLAAALSCDLHSSSLEPAQAELLGFVQLVTESSQMIRPCDTERLHPFGWTDLQIAEAIHLAALFACFNRVVNAFGLPSQSLLGIDSPGNSHRESAH
jgi:uncharacterized peroxidase-related enzyme